MTAIRPLPIPIDQEKIAAFCRERQIRKLSLYGAVLREDFDPARSDVNVVVEMEPNARTGFRFFGYGDELAAIFGTKVDFGTVAMISSCDREKALADTLTLYEHA